MHSKVFILLIFLIQIYFCVDVGILGAGISGISVAKTFFENGFENWEILESRDSIGGRMMKSEIGGLTVEKGANWIQGGGSNPIYKWALKCGIDLFKQNWDSEILYDKYKKTDYKSKNLDKAFKCIENLIGKKTDHDVDIATGLTMCKWKAKTRVDKILEWYNVDYETATTASQTSLNATFPLSTYEDFGENDYLIYDKRGASEILNCIIEKLKMPVDKIHFGKKVVSISTYEKSENVLVELENGEKHEYKYVVITFSLGVLQEKFDQLFGKMVVNNVFKNTLFKYHMKTYMKIFLKFPERFWDTEDIILLTSDSTFPMTMIQSLDPNPLPGSKIIFFTFTDKDALIFEQMEKSEVVNILMDTLKKLYGNSIPQPLDIMYPQWDTDDNFYGSYSNVPPGFKWYEYEILEGPLFGRIHFAGEALCKRMSGYMQSGFLMGKKIANKILKSIGYPTSEFLNYCDTSPSTKS